MIRDASRGFPLEITSRRLAADPRHVLLDIIPPLAPRLATPKNVQSARKPPAHARGATIYDAQAARLQFALGNAPKLLPAIKPGV